MQAGREIVGAAGVGMAVYQRCIKECITPLFTLRINVGMMRFVYDIIT
jgi:hypothetical protein